MKKCPFCAEEIQDAAIKCRYCGEFLDRRKAPRTTSSNGCLIGCLFIIFLLAISWFVFVTMLIPNLQLITGYFQKSIAGGRLDIDEAHLKQVMDHLQELIRNGKFPSLLNQAVTP